LLLTSSDFGFSLFYFIFFLEIFIDYNHVDEYDNGWGCGYRNFQNLYSFLLKIPAMKSHLKSGMIYDLLYIFFSMDG
jgi:hypothetical protein